MKTRDEIKGIRLPVAEVRSRRSAATAVIVATVLFLAAVVAVLALAFRTDDTPATGPAPAPPVTVEYYGAPAD